MPALTDEGFIASITDSDGNFDPALFQEKCKALGRNIINHFEENHPGFFSPYLEVSHFAYSAASVIAVPLALGILSALIAASTAIAATVFVGSLVASGILAAAKKTDEVQTAFTVATIAGIATVAAPLLAALFALAVVVTCVYEVTNLITRTGATAVYGISQGINFFRPQPAVGSEVPLAVEEEQGFVPV